jgi:hypothetical protein
MLQTLSAIHRYSSPEMSTRSSLGAPWQDRVTLQDAYEKARADV